MGGGGKLAGGRTQENLRRAFAACSQANRRYLHYARVAESRGDRELAAVLRETALAEAAHAFGHLERLEAGGVALEAAIARELQEHLELYPQLARVAREEGLPEIAERFEALARAGRLQAERIRAALARAGRA